MPCAAPRPRGGLDLPHLRGGEGAPWQMRVAEPHLDFDLEMDADCELGIGGGDDENGSLHLKHEDLFFDERVRIAPPGQSPGGG
jgi:hypothetical protein